jgi:hypothetical protein
MNDSTPEVRDLMSVGTRVSWGAIAAGALLAAGIGVLCATLGAAVGLSVEDRLSGDSMRTGVMAWGYISTFIALFVGGMVTSLLTVGENKTEAVVHGVLMWALLLTGLLLLGSAEPRVGINITGIPHERITVLSDNPEVRRANEDTARRVAWYSFAGTWLSMLAAAGGALAGAGPTFRVVMKPRVVVTKNAGTR